MEKFEINFDTLRELVEKVSKANGRKANTLTISRELYEENIDSFKSGYWEDLKVEIVDDKYENTIYVSCKQIII